MKKISLISIIISSWALCFAHVGDHSASSTSTDFSLYKNVQFIKSLDVKQPTIVEIQNLSPVEDYVVVDDHGVIVQQQSKVIRKSTIIPPLRAEGCISTCKDARVLLDGNESTTFDFSLTTAGYQKGKINIVYDSPIETDAVSFQATRDSYMPTSFTLTIDGKRVLNTIQGGSARFPKMSAKDVVIEFEYNQPIRFTEVGVGLQKEETMFGALRFVYQPQEKYTLYTNAPTGKEHVAQSAIDLFSKNKEADGVLEEVRQNPLYKERDSDGDDVVDSVDNCVLHTNSDQKDSNRNGVGDVCDDYDYDGIATYRDNCPEMGNPDQKDTDRDGQGDMCDSEESRITEKYGWMPWVVFVGVLGAILAMGYEVIRMKKAKDGKVV